MHDGERRQAGEVGSDVAERPGNEEARRPGRGEDRRSGAVAPAIDPARGGGTDGAQAERPHAGSARPVIREATLPADKAALIELVANFLDGTRYGELLDGASWSSISGLIDRVYLSGTIFVADIANPDRPSGRELVGMLGIIVALHPVTGRPYADELAWWVNPAH